MSGGMCYKNYLRKYLIQWKYTDSHRLRACRAIHETIPMPSHVSAINAGANERTAIDQKPMRNMKNGPSLKDFLSPSVIDIPTEESIPYVQNVSGKNQKGFSNIYEIYHLSLSFNIIILTFSVRGSVL